ncbi:hypothetical protein NUSPORA_01151 [Nucleospora cyclopteri]
MNTIFLSILNFYFIKFTENSENLTSQDVFITIEENNQSENLPSLNEEKKNIKIIDKDLLFKDYLQDFFYELANIFIVKSNRINTNINPLLVILNDIIKKGTFKKNPLYPIFDFGLGNIYENMPQTDFPSNIHINFDKYELIFFSNQNLDVLIAAIQSNIIINFDKNEFFNEYNAALLYFKNAVNANYLQIKQLLIDKIKILLKTKKEYAFFRLKYNSSIDYALNPKNTNQIQFEHYCNAKIHAKQILSHFKSYVKYQMEINLTYSELQIIIDLTSKLNEFNIMLAEKLDIYSQIYSEFNDDEKNSPDLACILTTKFCEYQKLEIKNANKLLDESSNYILQLQKNIDDSKESLDKAHKVFLKDKQNLKNIKHQLETSNSKFKEYNNKYLQTKLEKVKKSKNNYFAVKKQFYKMIQIYWNYMKNEHFSKIENYHIQLNYLRFFLKEISLTIFIREFLQKSIFNIKDLINIRIHFYKHIVKESQKNYYMQNYKFIKIIAEEKDICQNSSANKLEILKLLKNKNFINSLERFDQMLKIQDYYNSQEFFIANKVILKELKLRQFHSEFEILWCQIFLEFKFKLFCENLLDNTYCNENNHITQSCICTTALINAFCFKLKDILYAFSLFLIKLHNARSLLHEENTNFKIKMVNETFEVFEKDLIKNAFIKEQHKLKNVTEILNCNINNIKNEHKNLRFIHISNLDTLYQESKYYWNNKNIFFLKLKDCGNFQNIRHSFQIELQENLEKFNFVFSELEKHLNNYKIEEDLLYAKLKKTQLLMLQQKNINEESESNLKNAKLKAFSIFNTNLNIEKHNFTETLKDIFFQLTTFIYHYNFEKAVSNFESTMFLIYMAENEFYNYEKNHNFPFKTNLLFDNFNNCEVNINILLIKACNNYIKYIYCSYKIDHLKILLFEMTILHAAISEELAYLQQQYNLESSKLRFLIKLDINNTQIYFIESKNFLDKISHFYTFQSMTTDNAKKNFYDIVFSLTNSFLLINKNNLEKIMEEKLLNESFLPSTQPKQKSKKQQRLFIYFVLFIIFFTIFLLIFILYIIQKFSCNRYIFLV